MVSYEYETSPRKLQPEYEPKKKTAKNNKNKANKKVTKNKAVKKNVKAKTRRKPKYNYKPIAYIMLGFAMLFVISYRNSLINEDYNKKENIKSQVSAMQKENEQLKVSIENSLNLNSVEQSAKDKLGMQKLDNNQKVYIDLQKKDYVESASEEVVMNNNNMSWLDKILSKFIK